MKVVILYHPESEHARSVLTFKGDFERFSSVPVELLSLEEVDGAEKAKVYGIISYPAVLVVNDSGELVKFWEGSTLPLINEVVSYII